MVQPAPSKQTTQSLAAKGKSRERSAVAYLLTGDDEAVKGLVIPKGLKLRRFKGPFPNATGKDMESESALRTKPVPAAAFEPDAKAKALLQGVSISEQILAQAGGAFELKEVTLLLNNISRQAVDRRVQDKALLAVPGPGNRRWYPTLQFTDQRQVVDGLKPVMDALPTDNPWVALSFLSQPNDQLDGACPIKLLKAGEVDRVVNAARNLAEQGA